jgi:hypothetical protein
VFEASLVLLEDYEDSVLKAAKAKIDLLSLFPILSFLPSLRIFSTFQWRNHGKHPSNSCASFYPLSSCVKPWQVMVVPKHWIPVKHLLF